MVSPRQDGRSLPLPARRQHGNDSYLVPQNEEDLMPTFIELQTQLSTAKYRKAILLHLIEHIDENFRPVAGGEPKLKLLTDDKIPVPLEMFEAVAAATLSAEVDELDHEIAQIMGAVLAPDPQSAPGPVLPTPVADEAAPRRRRGRRRSTQPSGESR